MNNRSGAATAQRSVAIIGGGYSGACIAVHLLAQAKYPLDITIIEPAARLGPGLAYSTSDPDHRLNGPTWVHTLLPDDVWHFARWCLAQNLPESDPQCLWPDGGMYMRRRDFGRYLEDTLARARHAAPEGTRLEHFRGMAVDIIDGGNKKYQVVAQDSSATPAQHLIDADLVFIATGNAVPRLQAPFNPALARQHNVIENPLDGGRLKALPPQARVLLVGNGLTALDVLTTLVQQGHRGEMQVVSRRGLRPKPQAPLPPMLTVANTLEAIEKIPGRFLLDRIQAPAPAHFTPPGGAPRLSRCLRILRNKVAESEAAGGTWHTAFDELRDSLWQVWPTLSPVDKRRFMRRLRPWYDIHRFRTPPYNEAIVRAAEERGQIRFAAARLKSVTATPDQRLAVTWSGPRGQIRQAENFDAIVNCTGLDALAGLKSNPLLARLLETGALRPDACATGVEVDATCCAVNSEGQAQPGIRVLGPPTFGTFGDPIGAMFIAAHIHRIMPGVMQALGH